jgi:hypothetical protein
VQTTSELTRRNLVVILDQYGADRAGLAAVIKSSDRLPFVNGQPPWIQTKAKFLAYKWTGQSRAELNVWIKNGHHLASKNAKCTCHKLVPVFEMDTFSFLACNTYARGLLRRSPAVQEAFVGEYCIWTTSPYNKQFGVGVDQQTRHFSYSSVALQCLFFSLSSPIDWVSLQMDYNILLFWGLVSSC